MSPILSSILGSVRELSSPNHITRERAGALLSTKASLSSSVPKAFFFSLSFFLTLLWANQKRNLLVCNHFFYCTEWNNLKRWHDDMRKHLYSQSDYTRCTTCDISQPVSASGYCTDDENEQTEDTPTHTHAIHLDYLHELMAPYLFEAITQTVQSCLSFPTRSSL